MQKDQYIQLLQKQLSGEIGAEEQQQLDHWLAESAEHRQIAYSIEKAWDMSENYQPTELPEIDLDTDFALLEKRFTAAEKETPVRQLKASKTPWLRIAAAVALILVAGFLLRQWMNTGEDWQTLATVEGERQEITLADGSQVWLNENTEIQYPEDFDGTLREIKLKGEAFFEVEKNPKQAFVVYTNSGAVRVLGTSFNVRDIAGEANMKVQVKTGKVQVSNEDGSAEVILMAGEQGQINKTQNTVEKINEAIDNALFWQTGLLVFNNDPLSKVIKELESAYKVRILLENENLLDECLFTSTFKQKRIKHILNTIATVFGMELEEQNEKTYQLKGGSC